MPDAKMVPRGCNGTAHLMHTPKNCGENALLGHREFFCCNPTRGHWKKLVASIGCEAEQSYWGPGVTAPTKVFFSSGTSHKSGCQLSRWASVAQDTVAFTLLKE